MPGAFRPITSCLVPLAVAVAGFCILAFVVPNVVVRTHRDAEGRVSADVSWRSVLNLVTIRRVHIDDFEGAEVESLVGQRSLASNEHVSTTTVRLRLRSRNDSWLAQLMASADAVHAAERRLNAFKNCINCDAGEETTIVPGWVGLRVLGGGLLLFGGAVFLVGAPLTVRRALRHQ